MTDRRFVEQHTHNLPPQTLQIQCRFCQQTQQFNQQQMAVACACIAPNRYVHRRCLQSWAISQYKNADKYHEINYPEQFKIVCDICKKQMRIYFKKCKKLINYQQFVNNSSAHKLLLSFLIFIVLLTVGIVIYMTIGAIYQDYGFQSLYISVVSISAFTFVFTVILFFWEFILLDSVQVERILDYEDHLNQKGKENNPNQENYNRFTFNDQIIQNQEKTDSLYQRSLKQESVRSGIEAQPNDVLSKTFTDISMKKMYEHDRQHQKNSDLFELNSHLKSKAVDELKQKIGQNLLYIRQPLASGQQFKTGKFTPKSTAIETESVSKQINQTIIHASFPQNSPDHLMGQFKPQRTISEYPLHKHNTDKPSLLQQKPPKNQTQITQLKQTQSQHKKHTHPFTITSAFQIKTQARAQPNKFS